MGVFEKKFRRDLGLRGMRPNTIETYVRCCRQFVGRFTRSPMELTVADIRAHLERLRLSGKAPRTVNVHAAALACFYGETLGRRDEIGRIPRLRVRCTKLPSILTGGEIEGLVNALRTPRQRALVVTLYGAGRASHRCVEFHTACATRIERRVSSRGASVGCTAHSPVSWQTARGRGRGASLWKRVLSNASSDGGAVSNAAGIA